VLSERSRRQAGVSHSFRLPPSAFNLLPCDIHVNFLIWLKQKGQEERMGITINNLPDEAIDSCHELFTGLRARELPEEQEL
jgi:hypothetical protein